MKHVGLVITDESFVTRQEVCMVMVVIIVNSEGVFFGNLSEVHVGDRAVWLLYLCRFMLQLCCV